MIVTKEGIPVEYIFTPGSSRDMQGLKQMPLNLPEGSTLYADAAYTDYTIEEMLSDDGIRLLAARKANSKRPHKPWVEYLISIQRKRIEVSLLILQSICLKRFMQLRKMDFLLNLLPLSGDIH
jgi:transposase